MAYYRTAEGTKKFAKNRKLNNHFLVSIVDDVFEDFLEEKGVVIENKDRDLDDGAGNIWGDDFDEVMNKLRDVCEQHGIYVSDSWE